MSPPTYFWTYSTSVSPPLAAECTPPQCLPHLLLNIHHLSVSPHYCWTYTTLVSPHPTAEPTQPLCLPPLPAEYTPLQYLPHFLLNIHHFNVSPTYCWTYTTLVSSLLTAEPMPPQCLHPTSCWIYTTSMSPPLTTEHTPPLILCVCGRMAAWEGRHITWCTQGSRMLMIAHLLRFREGAAWGNHHEGLCSSCLLITTGLCAHRTGHGQGWVP